MSKREQALLRKALDFIHAHLSEDLSTARIARSVGCSQSVLQRLVRQGLGETLFTIVRNERLSVARLALMQNRVSIAEAAALSGYATPESFSTAFLKKFGERPISLRARDAST